MLQKTRRMVTQGGLEWRADSDTVTVEGHASTFNQAYDMGWYQETVAPGAFTKTLKENPDVRLLVNHDGLPLARTKSGTLDLSQDDSGLYMRSVLDANDPDVQRIVPKMQRGDLNEMSFAFSTVKEDWSPDLTQRTLNELSLAGGDVSVVTYPANPNASVGLKMRALATESPDKLRDIYRMIKEDRAGAKLSAATTTALKSALESLGAIDDNCDDAMEALNGLMAEPDQVQQNAGRPVRDLRILIDLARR
jgi:HK97 family phage prohead protease